MSKKQTYQPYTPKEIETEIYALWEKACSFTPKIDPRKKPFTVIMPPPNANGSLHIGHAMFVTLEDIMIRYHRMLGDVSLWLPGADHAGILTQVVYERKLKKERGTTRHDLGREQFYRETMEFTLTNKKVMENQLKALGASCDWTRNRFTLNPKLTPAIYLTFKKLYDAGLVYRGERMINWCSRCATALSDLEVDYQEEKTQLTYIAYPLNNFNQSITVATTRPETMLGDTAVAVNPADKRYTHFVGKTVMLPLVNREIHIIADEAVDPKFGTGAVKVTPGHDPVDFEIGMRHHLPIICVIGTDNRTTDKVPNAYRDLSTSAVRERVIADLRNLNLIEKQKEYLHRVGHCERCKSIIEPLVSLQWFITTQPLAKPVIAAVEKGKVTFVPKRFEKTFITWMKNLKDWCVSRQIWWGIRMPVFYCDDCQAMIVPIDDSGRVTPPTKCPTCGSTKIRQETDTFDTWFSSGQWPYITLGWPEKTPDFTYFYPTTVMETGYEILNIWVARMLMLGIFATGKAPFQTVYLHGMVRDAFGQKMSKSLPETAINPLDAIGEFGADALRMALVTGSGPGNDVSVTHEKIKGYRNFVNKVWNASRFVLQHLTETKELQPPKTLETDDKHMLREIKRLIQAVTKDFDNFRFGRAGEKVYNSFWHVFCDQYVEVVKARLYGDDAVQKQAAQYVLQQALTAYLALLHPFVPFVTETIWQKLPWKKGRLIDGPWPTKK